MKKTSLPKLLVLSLSSLLLLSCGTSSSTSSDVTSYSSATESTTSTSVSASIPSFSSTSVPKSGDTSSLSVSTSDGSYSSQGSDLTINSGGTYTFSGQLNGVIYVDAGDDDEVEIDLNGVTLVSDENSPIYIANASEVKIKAIKDTENIIEDQRPLKTTEDATQGEGAIYSTCDLKLVGQGSLTVVGSYNNGIHGKDDVKIKNQTLSVKAPHHAIKGNDSITIEEGGNFTFISTGGDGLHTENSGVSSKGNQKGDITITAGKVTIYSATDGLDAAHDVIIASGEDDTGNVTTPSISITTNKYSSYTEEIINLSESLSTNESIAYLLGPGGGGGNPGGGGVPGGNPGGGGNSDKADESAKGIKAGNLVDISAGSIVITAYDDGIHANYGDALENGKVGQGDVNVSGGTLNIQASDDGIHADRYLNISGGTHTVSGYEGLEGNQITISGGDSVVYGTDDGVNATSGSLSEIYFKATGGNVFIEVSSNGDTDGIDSNGNVYIQGGHVIACGPNSWMAAALDYEGRASVSSGSLILIGAAEGTPSTSGVTSSSKSYSYSANSSYTLTFSSGSTLQTGKMKYSHSGTTTCWSSLGSLSSITKN